MSSEAKKQTVRERRFVAEGTLIMREGDPGNSAYLLQSGHVSVFTKSGDKVVELARLGPGEIFGEMALVFDEHRKASVKAVEDCTLIVLSRSAFKEKLNKSDPTVRAIVKMLTQRIVTSNEAVSNKKSDVGALVETANTIYQNILADLPKSQQQIFDKMVMPHLAEFLKAVEEYNGRFDA